MNVQKDVRIIVCNSIDFDGKDVIEIKDWKDFEYLFIENDHIFKIRNTNKESYYYILSDNVAFVYKEKKQKTIKRQENE